MPRTLPWLEKKTTKASTAQSSRTEYVERPPKRARVLPPNVEDPHSSDEAPTPAAHRIRLQRTPSTSPPPVPPDQECMLESGQDDIWVMVEDEFLATAQLFTQHLHRAEYLRLKELAKLKSPATLRAVDRPVDEKTKRSADAMRMQLKGDHARGVRKALSAADPDNDGEQDWIRDHNLAGLMGSPRRKRVDRADLTGLVGPVKSNTRAAAGFDKHRNNVSARGGFGARTFDIASRDEGHSVESMTIDEDATTSDDDDLDAPALRPRPTALTPKPAPAPQRYKDIDPKTPPRPNAEMNDQKNAANPDFRSGELEESLVLSRQNPVAESLQGDSKRSPTRTRARFETNSSPQRTPIKPWRRKGNLGIKDNEPGLVKAEEIPTFLV